MARHAAMIKKFMTYLVPLMLLTLHACVTEDEFADNPRGNFEALWKIMDEHYCFFEEKGVDWDKVYVKYSKQIDEGMTENQLFEVLCNMLAEVKDGHVNLFSNFDIGRYWGFHEKYPSNYSDTLINKYLGTDYKIANGFSYRILDDNIGYIKCSTFQNNIGPGNLDEILLYLAPCNGLIIDLRQNGGGLLTSAEELAARFTNEPLLVGYMRHKTGKGHHDFSKLMEQTLKPAKRIRWQKEVVVLTNRQVFSAANEFVKYMKCCPKATIVGDKTGGGAGLPFSSEIPNGWSVRFSACPMYDKDKQSTEDGISPDIPVSLSIVDFRRGRDTIIEAARQFLRKPQTNASLTK
jgi:hypothetical protein